MRNVRDYAVITGSYWAFTVTDGALRMLVLLHLHEIGYSPIEIVSLFLFYEFFGIVTNLLGGLVAARFGLKSTLLAGLLLQIVACSMLSAGQHHLTVPLLMVAQAFSGTAKDLTKMSAKSYIKLVVPDDDQRGLMKWVSVLTGSKNALKGAGFFVGGVMLSAFGFGGACFAMAFGLSAALALTSILLPQAAGKSKTKATWKQLFSKDPRINWLSAARLFVFGSRDVWFVLALPVFLASGLGWSYYEVGAFLALWIIGYGAVQAASPAWLSGKGREPPTARTLGVWTALLVVPLGAILAALRLDVSTSWVLVVGLCIFGFVFAANSATHSYLVVAYSDRDKVALNVGFYYMANAAGRLVGTVLSGVAFQAAGSGLDGLKACIAVSISFVVVSTACCVPLRLAERRGVLAVSSS